MAESFQEPPRLRPRHASCTSFHRSSPNLTIVLFITEVNIMATQTQKDGRAQMAEGHIDRETLIEGLNSDLAGEYQAILMYTHYAAMLTGPFRKELRSLFQGEIADEQGHAQFL